MRRLTLPLFTAFATALALSADATTIIWNTDLNGDWNTAGNWSPAALPTAADDVVIDRGGANGGPPAVTHSAGTTTVQSLTNNETVVVSTASSLTTGDFNAGAGADLRVSGGASFTASGAVSIDGSELEAQSGGQIDLTTLTDFAASGNTGAVWRADGQSGGTPSRIDASGTTVVSGATLFGRRWQVEAINGGEIDLSGATSLADSNVSFVADGAGSLVDISGVEMFSDAVEARDSTSTIEARGGGEVRLRSDPAANLSIDRYLVVRDGASSTLDTSRLTNLTNSRVQVLGAGTTLDLTNLASYDTNSFEAFDGASLTLDATSYTAAGGDNRSRFFTADGSAGGPSRIDGSSITTLTGGTPFGQLLSVEAVDGGEVDLQNVTTLNDSNVIFRADGAGSLVDISGVEMFSDAVEARDSTSTIEARGGGEVRLRSDPAANLSIDRYVVVRDGASSALDTSRLTNLTNSRVQVLGAGTTLDLTNLASYDTNSFEAFDGASLTLDATSYTAAGGDNKSRFITADGSAGGPSRIDGSSITTLTGGAPFGQLLSVEAVDGGEVDLQNVTTLNDSNVIFRADGAGSLVDISGVETFSDAVEARDAASTIEARGGGEVRLRSDPAANLSIDRYVVVRDGASSVLDTSRVTSLTNSRVQALGAATTLDLTNVASYDTNSFEAFDGAFLTLDTPSYTAAGGDNKTRFFTADGAAGMPSRIDGSAIATLTGASAAGQLLQIEALDGGEVDLQNVTTLTDSNVMFRARGVGSLVDISSIETFSDAVVVQGAPSSIEARNGGEVRLRSDPGANLSIDRYVVVREAAISTLDTSRVTSFTNSRLQVIGAGTTLDLSNIGSYDTNSFEAFNGAFLTLDTPSYNAAGGDNATRFFTADGAAGVPSRIDGSAVTTLGGASVAGRLLQIDARGGGEIDLQNVTSLTGNAAIVADGAGSFVDLSTLATFDNTPGVVANSSIDAMDGGLVQLHETAKTQITNVDLNATLTGTIQGATVEALGASRVRGIGTLALDQVINQAFLDPGLTTRDAGQITLTGDLTQTALGTLDIDIGGLIAMDYDTVHVLGDAILGGEIRVRFFDPDGVGPLDDFDPQVGDIFGVLTAASIFDDGIFVSSVFADGRLWETEIFSGIGGDVLRLRVAVPEPSTFQLITLGLIVIAIRRPRRRG